MKKVLIYVCDLAPKHLTLEFQEKNCRKLCEREGIDNNNIVVLQDDYNKTKLPEVFNHIDDYSHVIIFSLSCLGNNYLDIAKNIDKAMENQPLWKCVTCGLVFFKDKPLNPIMHKMMINHYIGFAVFETEMWEKLNID